MLAGLRSRLGRMRYRGIHAVRRLGAPGRWFYFTFLGDGIRRELAAVSAGQTRYFADQTIHQHVYRVRRQVHMLEKGLVMVPRRETFAADYIRDTVTCFERVSGDGQERLSKDELAWAFEVLHRYFAATEGSVHPEIVEARYQFRRIEADLARSSRGPLRVADAESPVPVDRLLELAVRRSSVRQFEPVAVERGIIERAVEIAVESPTACNRQPYKFLVFDDPEQVRAVASVPMGTRGYEGGLSNIAVLVGDLSAFPDERDRHLIYIDGCLAAMSFILGLESQGIASCCINWPDIAEKDRQMAKLLGLAAHERVVMLIAFGHASPEAIAPYSQKKPVHSAVSFNMIARANG